MIALTRKNARFAGLRWRFIVLRKCVRHQPSPSSFLTPERLLIMRLVQFQMTSCQFEFVAKTATGRDFNLLSFSGRLKLRMGFS